MLIVTARNVNLLHSNCTFQEGGSGHQYLHVSSSQCADCEAVFPQTPELVFTGEKLIFRECY